MSKRAALALIVVVVTAGCGSAPSEASSASEDALVVSTPTQPDDGRYCVRTAAPGKKARWASTIGSHNTYNGLVYLSTANKPLDFAIPPRMIGGPSPGTDALWRPVAGDWTNSGRDTLGYLNTANGMFYLTRDNQPFDFVTPAFPWSGPSSSHWYPVAGDWDGDGFDTVGSFEATSGVFYLSRANAAFDFAVPPFVLRAGAGRGWYPFAGDWDGDGKDEVGLYDANTGLVYLASRNAAGATLPPFALMPAGSLPPQLLRPVAGDWFGEGRDHVGLYNPSDGKFYLSRHDATNSVAFPPTVWASGAPTDWVPLAGQWRTPTTRPCEATDPAIRINAVRPGDVALGPRPLHRIDYTSARDGESDWALALPPNPATAGRNPSGTWVVALHGHGATGNQIFAYPGLSASLASVEANGLGVLAPNLRDKNWMGPRAAEDLHALLAFARTHYGAKRFVLLGGSMGGTGTLLYSAVHPEDVAGIVALCPASDLTRLSGWLDEVIARPVAPAVTTTLVDIRAAIVAAYGGTASQVPATYAAHSALVHAPSLPGPLYLAHGTSDVVLPVQGADDLATALAGLPNRKVNYARIPGGGHDTPLDNAREGLDWVLANLSP